MEHSQADPGSRVDLLRRYRSLVLDRSRSPAFAPLDDDQLRGRAGGQDRRQHPADVDPDVA